MEFDGNLTPEETKVFLDEAEELLDILERDILRLEDESDNEDLLQEIFRAAHTLKGSAATLGHQRLTALMHAVEGVFDRLRSHRIEVVGGLVDLLFSSLDLMRALVDEVRTGEEAAVELLGVTLARLRQVVERGELSPADGVTVAPAPAALGVQAVGGVPVVAAAPTASGVSGAPVAEVAPVTQAALVAAGPGEYGATVPPGSEEQVMEGESSESVQEQLRQGVKDGYEALRISVELAPDSIMPAVRAYQVILALGENGKVVESSPSLDEIEEERVGNHLEVLFLTQAPREALRQAVVAIPDVTKVDIRRLQVGEGGIIPEPVATRPATAGAPGSEPGSGAAESKSTSAAGAAAGAPGAVAAGGGLRISSSAIRSVRVDVKLLDELMNLVGELVIDRTRLAQILQDLATRGEAADLAEELNLTAGHIGRTTSQLQEEIMKARMLPLDSIFKKFPRMVRDLAQGAGKQVEFIIEGEETELDRSVLQEIGDPLIHLLRNAVDHGIEPPGERVKAGKSPSGTIRLSACHRENQILITVSDDGAGIDPTRVQESAVRKGLISQEAAARLSRDEALELIFLPGLSTARRVSEVSGRGVGMDVVKKNIERVNGSIEIKTEVGKGTTFSIRLPLTLAIVRALLVGIGECTYAIPLSSILEIIKLNSSELHVVKGQEVVALRDRVFPLIRLGESFYGDGCGGADEFIVIVNTGGREVGLTVETLIGEQEVVLKSLGGLIGEVPGIAGATILGDGSVALILDIPGLMRGVPRSETIAV
ncbi:MAG: chemotaxis protein CheA [Firmicutes bacterium]|nr:chemotaxis protein CheA [Bacillota bacterium]